MIEYIREQQSEEELLCQLAEEAIELAHAALKYRRSLTGTSPTTVKRTEAFNNLLEEIADVWLLLEVLKLDKHLVKYGSIMEAKLKRWVERLKTARQEDAE